MPDDLTPGQAAEFMRIAVRDAKNVREAVPAYAQVLSCVPVDHAEVWKEVNAVLLDRWAPSTVNRIKSSAWAHLPETIRGRRLDELKAVILEKLTQHEQP